MDTMPRKLPLYVSRERTRHGRIVFYFRRGKGSRTRLPGINDPQFEDSYRDAFTNTASSRIIKGDVNSLDWLIGQYRRSSTYLSLASATRKQRDNIFRQVDKTARDVSYKKITRQTIVAGRERRASTPAQAGCFLKAMRGLFKWALETGFVRDDPTTGISNLKYKTNGGFPAWTEEDVAVFEAFWAEGTRERVWLHVLLYTGLRRGDAVILGKQHVKNGIATIRTEKTGMEVTIPILPDLAHTLATSPTGDPAFITGARGQHLVKESFGNLFRTACNKAGLSKSAHGLRKLAATITAEAGATVNELEARFGWSGGDMAMHYTKTADRKRLALSASEKILNRTRPSQ